MNRAIIKGAVCQSCRHEVIRSFLSISGVSLPRNASLSRSIYNVNTRAFSAVPRLKSDNVPPNSADAHISSIEERDRELGNNASSTTQPIPWYLQEEAPVTESHPLSSQQQIPELPENPPAILPDLLEYTFKDLGLDNLKLIDLRGLETPPALGANVIMIIGTARSVKHLNVSADRLCRWLRSTWKLTPYADGLLGRNELKIKLRRKARRARIASKAGAMLDEKDDGITTGWICVNAGLVKDDSIPDGPTEQNFEGFGTVERGSRIIVQIFTEEKRSEVDLESLWASALERSGRQKQKTSNVIPDAPHQQVRATSAMINRPSSDHILGNPLRPPRNIPYQQRRGLHMTRRLALPRINSNSAAVQPTVVSEPSDGALSNQDQTSTHTDTISPSTVHWLLRHLSELSNEQVQDELGNGLEDHDSTLFLRLFYDRPVDFPARDAALVQMKLLCIAILRKHPSYRKEDLWNCFMDYLCAGYPLSDQLGMQVVAALLEERPVNQVANDMANTLPDADKELALQALEHLSLRGIDVLTAQVFNMLYKAASCTPPSDPRTRTAGVSKTRSMAHKDNVKQVSLLRISNIVAALKHPFEPNQARPHMLHLFRCQDYDGFWKLWRKIPLSGKQRTAEDYEALFQLHAELGDMRRARDCIMAWVPMMRREDPPIVLEGKVVKYIAACIMIAKPDVEKQAQEGLIDNVVSLWMECQQKLAQES